MKLRLPLSLLGALSLAPLPSNSDIITGDVNWTTPQTITDLYIGNSTDKVSGNLTINLANDSDAITVSGKFQTFGVTNDDTSSLTLNKGTLNITTSGSDGAWLGGANQSATRSSSMTMNGGVLNILNTALRISRWGEKSTLDINGGTANLKGIEFQGRESPGVVTLAGGRLNIGSSGITHYKDADHIPAGVYTFLFTGGTLGALADWEVGPIPQPDNFSFSFGDNTADLVIDTKNPTSDAKHTISIVSKIDGTGGGDLILAGGGTVNFKGTGSAFTKTIRTEGGGLGAADDSSLGTASTIYSTGDLTFISPSTTAMSKSFDIAAGKSLSLLGRTDYSLSDNNRGGSPLEFTGDFNLNNTASLKLDNAIITVGTGKTVTGDKFVIMWNSTVNVSGGTLNFNTSSDGFGNLSIGNENTGTISQSVLNVTNGGVFNAMNGIMNLSCWNDRGTLNISNGGTLNLKGIVLEGYAAEINITNGVFNIGEAGITSNNSKTRPSDMVGVIRFNSGTIHATATTAYSLNNTDNDNPNRGGYFHLGNDPGTERILSAASGVTFTISGLIQGDGGLVKAGEGMVVFDWAHTYTGETEVKEGILNFSANGSIASTSLKIHNGVSITGVGATSYGKNLTVTGINGKTTAAYWEGALNIENLSFADGKAKLSINGPLSVSGDITINIDPASSVMGPVMTLSGTNKLTLGGQINFLASNAVLDQVDSGSVSLQVINVTALADIGPVALHWNRDDEKYTFDTSTFATTGRVSWADSGLSFNLRTVTEGLSTPFAPTSDSEYMGARDPNVVFAENNTYTPFDGSTRLTNGMGNFTFQPAVMNSGDLFVLGMANGQGKVILTNNNNAQQSTKITEVTLVIDSTQGSSSITPSDTNPVGILGTGGVTIYGSTNEAGVLELRTGGDTTQAGSYWINNAITLNENTGITQTGANSHRLTGGLTVSALGRATITNESVKELIIESDIVMGSQSSLTFNGDAGKIFLTGNYAFSPTVLGVKGTAGLEITDGYTVNTTRVDLDGNSILTLSDGASLGIGNGGITGGGALNVSDSAINANASASIDAETTLGGQATFNISNAASTVTLEKGITGSGDLIKTGAGKLVVAAPASTSTTGDIIVRGGYLQLGLPSGATMVDGSPIPESYVLSGGLNVQSGTLSGIIDAAGHDLTFGSGSVFSLAIDMSKRSSSILGAGNIVVEQGATVHVNVLEQGWVTDTPYTIISSNTSISGAEFGLQLSGEYAFVNVVLSQTSKNVILTLSAKIPDITLSTPNEKAVFPTISYLVKEALNGRRGDLKGELLNEMQIVSKMTVDQLAEFVTETANSTASIYSALAGQVANTTRRVQSIRNRVVQLDPYLFDQYQLTDNRNIWVEGISNYSDIDSNSNAPGYRLDTWGGTMGLSFSLSPEAYMGVGFGYMSGKTRVKGNYGKTQTDSYDMDLFARYKKDEFSLSAVVSGGFSHVDYTRNMMFNGHLKTAEGKANGSQLMALVEAAYDVTLNESGTSILQPLVNVSTGYAKFRGFDETGLGNAGYHIDAQEVTMTTLGAGLRYIYSSQSEDSFIPARVEVRAMVTQDVGDVSYGVKANYLGAGGHTMNVTGVPLERTAFHVGVSGVLPVSLYTAFFADVTGEFRDGQNAVSASVGVNFQF